MLENDEAVRWVANHILPHEGALRKWLERKGVQPSEVDDIIQQTYCKLSELSSVAHIRDARAYFFTAARSFLLQRVRRDRVVRIQVASDQIDHQAIDQSPSPERAAGARAELRKVIDVIAALPKNYRETIELRRIEGLSQKETAQRLGVSEKTVENNLARGLKAVLRAFEKSAERYNPQDEEAGEPLRHVSQH